MNTLRKALHTCTWVVLALIWLLVLLPFFVGVLAAYYH